MYIFILGFLFFGSSGFTACAPMPDRRIVGGAATAIIFHPHQASLQLFGQHYCGASIISEKWIITAGHCVGASPGSYNVSVGSKSTYGGKKYRVERLVRHPKYDGFTIDYDIALIEINGTIVFNPTTRPIKLGSAEIPANTTAKVTGWGAVREGGPGAYVLQEVSVPIVSREICARAYATVNLVTERMICAGVIEEGGKDSCQGDSGGPLTANRILYGIVSWGYGCAKPKYPGVYSNVAYMRDWIRSVTGI